jgi:hypothetical protein
VEYRNFLFHLNPRPHARVSGSVMVAFAGRVVFPVIVTALLPTVVAAVVAACGSTAPRRVSHFVAARVAEVSAANFAEVSAAIMMSPPSAPPLRQSVGARPD